MKTIGRNTLKGNTIIEVMIAMAILSFCSVLAVVIYLNIQKSTLPFFKLKAVELAEFYLNRTINENKLNEETYTVEEFTVKTTANRSADYIDCFTIRVLVFDVNKKKIHELDQLVFKPY
jgi:prepilin-type N-terminal cleavage/methylation domain-containing protein